MTNMVTIGSKPAEGAFAAQRQGTEPPANTAAAQGLHVTESAVKRIRAAMAKEGVSPDAGGLRLGVSGGGCSGLSYVMKVDSRPRERDRVFEFDGVGVFLDPKFLAFFNGIT